MYGSWEWVFACGEFGGTFSLTRDTGGRRHRHRYTFRSDGTYTRVEQGVPAEQGRFSIKQRRAFNDDGLVPVLHFYGEEPSERVVMCAGADTLVLGDTGSDPGDEAYYARVSGSDIRVGPLPCPR